MPHLALPVLSPTAWALVALATFLVGLSKTGISGIGIVGIALYSLVLPPGDAVGGVLLILISADILAIATYRRDADWKQLWRLFPFAIPGVLLGFATVRVLKHLGANGEVSFRRLIALVLLLVVTVQIVQRLRKPTGESRDEAARQHPVIAPLTGSLGGFTTMAANAAGPIMSLYLLSMRLPKRLFVGTSAWFFFCMNLFKVPFQVALGDIHVNSPLFALALLPATLAGGFVGRAVLPRINQKTFETLAIAFTLAAALYGLRWWK